MTAKIKIDAVDILRCTLTSRYQSADLALEINLHYDVPPVLLADHVNYNVGIKDQQVMLIYDTLTITFTGNSMLLKRIDSYTNNKKWLHEKLKRPSVSSDALCRIESSIDEGRVSYDFDPVYLFDVSNKILLVKLFEDDGDIFYRLADNLIIGIRDDKIASLFIENIVMN